MKPIYSMTGYAAVRRHTPAGELGVTLRTVNGKSLDLHFHLNSEFAPYETAIRKVLKENLRRGHVEVRFSLQLAAGTATPFNRELLARYVAAFRAAKAEFGLASEPDLNAMLALPGVLEGASGNNVPTTETDVTNILEECLASLNNFREREGAELVLAITNELHQIEIQVASAIEFRTSALTALQSRLQERLTALLGDASIPPNRLVEEAAILADRSDIQEELTRLSVHTREVRRLLDEGGEVGKRLDFLMQEMNREANTVLSKSSNIGESGLPITNLGIALKANIERIREQALNIE